MRSYSMKKVGAEAYIIDTVFKGHVIVFVDNGTESRHYSNVCVICDSERKLWYVICAGIEFVA